MEYQEVYAAFERMSGCSSEEGQKLRPLIEAVIRWFAGQLKCPADALPTGHDPRLTEAVAAVSYARYLMSTQPDSAESAETGHQYQYRLGDLTVSGSDSSGAAASQTERLEQAERLRREALLSVADLLRDPQFIVVKA